MKSPTFEAILIVDNQWKMGIDNENGFCKIINFPPHNKFIQAKITDNVVVYGFNTFAENKFQAIPNCINIVICAQEVGTFKDCTVVHSLTELFEEVSKYEGKTLYVLGGHRTFKSLLPFIEKVYVTFVKKDLKGNILCPPFYNIFILANRSETKSYYKTEYEFQEYQQFFKTTK